MVLLFEEIHVREKIDFRVISVFMEGLVEAGLGPKDVEDWAKDPRLLRRMLAFRRNGSYGEFLSPAERYAREILGLRRVITVVQRDLFWFTNHGGMDNIFYSEDTLRRAAEENRQNEADWRLVHTGLSLWQQVMMCSQGVGLEHPDQRLPISTESAFWEKWGNTEESARKKVSSKYRLMDFRVRFGGMMRREQEDKLHQGGFLRSDEAAVCEAANLIYCLTGACPLTGAHCGHHISDSTFIVVGLNDCRPSSMFVCESTGQPAARYGVVVEPLPSSEPLRAPWDH